MSSALFAPTDPYDNVTFVDARVGPDARAQSLSRHLTGARFIDLDTELAEKGDPARGGRHPLPSTARFVARLEALGISRESEVVAYDTHGGANAAARFWWMLRAIGHPSVRVLDGGYAAAVAAGVPTRTGEETITPARYELPDRYARALENGTDAQPVVTLDAVKRALDERSRVVLDVRSGERHRGEVEPFDPIPGRIPGAVNLPFAENLGADGRFLAPDELRERYATLLASHGVTGPEALIVQCGSGVTACHTLLALSHAGLDGAALYVGSYSEWCRREPVAKGG